MKVLVINSYAGSITLGARAYPEADIIGVFENAGYGIDIQRHNFGDDYNFVDYEKYWPASIDLSNTVVLAHPPCSAFSSMNHSQNEKVRGIDAEAFECTIRILNYACKHEALGIGIESVIGTLGGAWAVHQEFANKYGYHLYRVMENGCMWGCQWRERFWIIYIKKDRAPSNMTLTIKPNFQTVSEVIDGYTEGPSAGKQDEWLDRQIERMRDCGCDEKELDYFFQPHSPPHSGWLFNTILNKRHPNAKRSERSSLRLAYMGTGWNENTMYYLHPEGVALTLLGQSHWYYDGRNLSEDAFKRIMGFPANYVFPDGPARNNMKQLLSKGVMPPIATWLCEQIDLHLREIEQHAQAGRHYQVTMEPGQFADFRIKKSDWEQRNVTLPPLRQTREDLAENTDWAPRASGRSTLDSYQYRLPFQMEES